MLEHIPLKDSKSSVNIVNRFLETVTKQNDVEGTPFYYRLMDRNKSSVTIVVYVWSQKHHQNSK